MINRHAIRSSLEMVRNNRAEAKLRLGSIAGFSVHQAACNIHNPQRPEKIDMILQTMSLSKQADLVLFKREGGNHSWLRQCGHSPFPAGELERQEWISPSHVNLVKTSSYSQNRSRTVGSGRYYCCNQICAACTVGTAQWAPWGGEAMNIIIFLSEETWRDCMDASFVHMAALQQQINLQYSQN